MSNTSQVLAFARGPVANDHTYPYPRLDYFPTCWNCQEAWPTTRDAVGWYFRHGFFTPIGNQIAPLCCQGCKQEWQARYGQKKAR